MLGESTRKSVERRETRARTRRSPLSAIYTLHKTPDGVEGAIHKRLIATFDSHDALFRWLLQHARLRGYGSKRTIFLGDGSEHIWHCQQKYFPDAEVCIDWYHVVEKLWEAAGCLHCESSDELAAWVERHKSRLRQGFAFAILDDLRREQRAIPETGPGNKGRRQRLGKVIQYFDEHAPRMRYAQLRSNDLDIGTGAVEGAVCNLVGLRLDGPGMRWGRARSELILRLCCILLNGQWDAFCSYLAGSQPNRSQLSRTMRCCERLRKACSHILDVRVPVREL